MLPWMEASPDIKRSQEWHKCLNLLTADSHFYIHIALTLLQQAFFDKDYINSHQEDTERITHLKDLMQEQVRLSFGFIIRAMTCYIRDTSGAFPHFLLQVHILGVGLAVHEKLVHPEMRPLHKKLVDQFHMMRTGLHHVSIIFFKTSYLILIPVESVWRM